MARVRFGEATAVSVRFGAGMACAAREEVGDAGVVAGFARCTVGEVAGELTVKVGVASD